MISRFLSHLLSFLYTVVFAVLIIWLGHEMIQQSSVVSSLNYKDQLSGGGAILQWMGGMAVLLSVFELVLWPWYSVKEAWDKHKNDPAFAGRMAEGWLIFLGFLIHALLWSSA